MIEQPVRASIARHCRIPTSSRAVSSVSQRSRWAHVTRDVPTPHFRITSRRRAATDNGGMGEARFVVSLVFVCLSGSAALAAPPAETPPVQLTESHLHDGEVIGDFAAVGALASI